MPIKQHTGLSNLQLQLLFALKLLAGVVNLYIHNNVFSTSDAAFYYWQSMGELQIALQRPSHFIHEWLFNWGDITGRYNIFNKENTPYWSNLGSLFHGKFMTLSNILSFGHFYVNVIFYNFFFFIGQLLLYKSFYTLRPDKKYLLLITIFLIPSILFWCSGIHKDGWVLTALGILAYYTIKLQNKYQVHYLSIVLCALLFLLLIRYFYFVCIVPAYLLWIFTQNKQNKFGIYTIAYLSIVLLFLTYGYLDPTHNPMMIIINKQQEFLTLKGISDVKVNILEPSIWSFISNAPRALYHILLLPDFNLSDPIRYQIASLDSMLVCIFIGIGFMYFKLKNTNHSFLLFALYFSITVYVFIGYTIPNSGAIVRYKSEFTALLLPTLVCLSEIPWLDRFILTIRNRLLNTISNE